MDQLKKSQMTLDLNVKLGYTYSSGEEEVSMEDLFGKLLVVVSVSYLAFHVVVELILK